MSIYNTAVNKPISTLMVFVAIMVLGVASYIQLPVDQYPKMDPPYLTVMATYPGANASDIEENVTKILEDQLNSVDNLKELTSTSYDNLAVVSLEFEWEANLDEASNDVRDAVDKAMQNLPDDIDRPTIMRFNTSMMPILIYAITADQSYPGIDKILDDKLITRLNRVDGVASVIISGAPERVVYVDLDPNKLDAYNLTLEQIGNKILAENKDISSGSVKMGQMDYTLRVEGEFEESDQIKNLVLGTQNNKTIYMHDVAVVRDTIKDITLEQTINRGNGGVLLITKQTDAILMTAAEVWFLRAEAALRGFTSENVKDCYEKGITVSCQQWGVNVGDYLTSDATPSDYVDAFEAKYDVKALIKVTPKWDGGASPEEQLERILTQKWIACYPEGYEAWTEQRRTGYPQLFKVFVNNSGGAIDTNIRIRRLPYPSDIQKNNPTQYSALKKALGGEDNGGTRLWWDTGRNF